jgi:hypothetical protein
VYDAPDLSPVRVVVNMEHPREIPREVRIKYTSDYRFRNVVPVQILRIWDMSQSINADGNYVPMYPAAAGAPHDSLHHFLPAPWSMAAGALCMLLRLIRQPPWIDRIHLA